MARPSKIMSLPPSVREWLETECEKRNYTGFPEIAAELNRRLEAEGEEPVGEEAVRRWARGREAELIGRRELVLAAAEALRQGITPDADFKQAFVNVFLMRNFLGLYELGLHERVNVNHLWKLQLAFEKNLRMETQLKFERRLDRLEAEEPAKTPEPASKPAPEKSELFQRVMASWPGTSPNLETPPASKPVPLPTHPVPAEPAPHTLPLPWASPLRTAERGPEGEVTSARFGTEQHTTTRNLTRQQRRQLEREQAKAARKAEKQAQRVEEKRAA